MANRPRLFSRLMLVFLGLVILIVAALAWNLRTPANDPEADLIRRQGYPATLTELDDWYRKVPDNQNAALIYTNAFAKLAIASNAFYFVNEGSWVPKRGEPITGEHKSELTAIFATNHEILELFFSAASLTNARYPIDLTQSFNAGFPHLAHMRGATLVLAARAMLHASEGESQPAVDCFLAAGRLNESVSQEPSLISHLVICSDWAVLCRRLEWTVNAVDLSSDQLERLQEMLAEARNGSFYRGLVGEQITGYAVFREPKWQSMLFNFTDFGATPSRSAETKSLLIVSALKTTGFFRKDKLFYLNAMSNYVALDRLPLAERFKASQSAPSFIPPSKFYLISHLLLPVLSKAITRDANRAAYIEVVETGLAIERFRRANANAIPENLEQLVPAYLPTVPLDPFDAKPLRFKKRGEGYVVYSVGSDQRDDGGAEPNQKNRNAPSDVTFILDH